MGALSHGCHGGVLGAIGAHPLLVVLVCNELQNMTCLDGIGAIYCEHVDLVQFAASKDIQQRTLITQTQLA